MFIDPSITSYEESLKLADELSKRDTSETKSKSSSSSSSSNSSSDSSSSSSISDFEEGESQNAQPIQITTRNNKSITDEIDRIKDKIRSLDSLATQDIFLNDVSSAQTMDNEEDDSEIQMEEEVVDSTILTKADDTVAKLPKAFKRIPPKKSNIKKRGPIKRKNTLSPSTPGVKARSQSSNKPHSQLFTSRIFTVNQSRLALSHGISFKKTSHVPRIHALQMSFYFKRIFKTIFKKRLSTTFQLLSESTLGPKREFSRARQNRKYVPFSGGISDEDNAEAENDKEDEDNEGDIQPKNKSPNYKVVLDNEGNPKILWNKSRLEELHWRLCRQKNINVLEIADSLKNEKYTKDYFKNVIIPLGVVSGDISQMTKKELAKQNQQLQKTSSSTVITQRKVSRSRK